MTILTDKIIKHCLEAKLFNKTYLYNRCSKKINGDIMDFNEYQDKAQTTAVYPYNLNGGIFYPALGLAGEVGELLNKIKKVARDNVELNKEDMKKELGDILWYVSQLSTELGIDFDEVASSNISKLKDRKDRKVLKGSGDDR